MPTDLRPTTGAGVPLAVLAAQIGAVLAAGPRHRHRHRHVPDVPVTGVTLRGQDVRPGDLFAALPGLTTHGARYAGRRDRARCRRGAHRRRRGRRDGSARRRGAGPGAPGTAQRARRPGRHGVRPSVGPGDGRRDHRHVRQDHHDVPGRGRSAGGGSGRRAGRHHRHPHRRRRHPQRADHPGGARAAGHVRGHGRARGGHRGDGGVQSRADPRPRGRHRIRGRRFHQLVARPPRLSPDHGRLLRGQGAAVRPGLGVAGAQGRGVRGRRSRSRDGRAGHEGRRRRDHRQPDRPTRPLARRRRDTQRRRPGRNSPPSTPPVCTTGSASTCRASTTSPIVLSRWQFSTRSGCPPSRRHADCGKPGFRGGSNGSTAARTFWRWSTTPTNRARCGRC